MAKVGKISAMNTDVLRRTEGTIGFDALHGIAKLPALYILFGLLLVFALTVDNFFAYPNLANIARLFAPLLIVALGMTVVFLVGGIDLSVGSTASLASIGCALAIKQTGDVTLGFAAAVAIGALIGGINGFAVALLRLPPLIHTLAMLLTVRAAALLVTGGNSVGRLPIEVLMFGRGSILGVPTLLCIALSVFLVLAIFVGRSRIGREIYLLGTSERAATFNGLRVRRTKFLAYLLCGVCAGVAGALIVARLGSGGPVVGDNLLLIAIAAVVLGGTSIMGGEGSMTRTLVGAAIVILLDKGLNLLGLTFYDQAMVMGAVIVLGSALSSYLHRRASAQ